MKTPTIEETLKHTEQMIEHYVNQLAKDTAKLNAFPDLEVFKMERTTLKHNIDRYELQLAHECNIASCLKVFIKEVEA